MKKLFSISMLIFLIISGMVVINKRIDDYFTKLLYGDKTEVSLLLKDDADCLALINSLKKISEGETSVSQYFFTSENELTIYDTNPDFLIKGRISHDDLAANYMRNKQKLLIPNYRYHVKLYPLDKIKNMGFNSVFYVSGNIKEFCDTMRDFGKVRIKSQKDIASFEDDQSTLLFLANLSGIISLLSLMFLLMKQKRQNDLMRLLGRKSYEILNETIKDLIPSLEFSIGISATLLFGYASWKNLVEYCSRFLVSLLLLYACCLLFILVIIIVACAFQMKTRLFLSYNAFFSKVAYGFNAAFFILSIFLVSIMFPKFHQEYSRFKEQASRLERWEDAKNIYQTNLTNQIDRMDNSAEVEYDLKAKNLWEKLRSNYQTFVVFSDNFLWTSGQNGKEQPWYLVNPDNKSLDDRICSVSGRAITADKNYLRLSKTILSDGKSVSDLKPTLFTKILIVPKKYGKYEKEIRNRYMDEFLFQLNTDFKLWKKRERVPKFTHKNLKIKIVYAKNGQSYFTYNPDSGDNLLSNTVKDPVIKLFDDYQNSLSYGNLFCLNGGFFFSDKHFGKVYERLEPKLRESGIGSTINFVTSVYSKKAELVQQNKRQVACSLIRLTVLVLGSFFFLFAMIAQYYLLHEREIVIKRLMGCSFFRILNGQIAFFSGVFTLSFIISSCLLQKMDWLNLAVLAFLFIGTVFASFIWISYDVLQKNRTLGRDF